MSETEDTRALDTMPKRLEYIRGELGVISVRQFWMILKEAGETASYEAVRTWHTHREPPAHYLAMVSQAFAVNLEWLVTGEGEPFQQADEVLKALGELEIDFGRVAKTGKLLPDHLAWVPEETLPTFLRTAQKIRAKWPFGERPAQGKVLRQLSALVRRPFDLLPFEPLTVERESSQAPDATFVWYVEAMLLAINMATAVEPDLGAAEEG